MKMDEKKPDYSYWDRFDKFNIVTAAYLMCDNERRDESEDRPRPFKVIDMIDRMKEGELNIKFKPKYRNKIHLLSEGMTDGAIFKFCVTRDALIKWCEQIEINKPLFLCPELRRTKKNTKPHGNTERNAQNRERCLGAALAVIFRFPENCQDAEKITRTVEEKALLFWPDEGEPPLKHEPLVKLIRKHLKPVK